MAAAIGRFARFTFNKFNFARFTTTLSLNSTSRTPTKYFSTTSTFNLKKVIEKTEGDVTTIEGEYVKSPREDFLMKLPEQSEKACPLCALDMEVKYTDVLIISQFLRPDGCPLPRRVTGLCSKQQKRLMKLTRQAQQAGLMPELRPDLPGGKERKHSRSQYKFKKYNVYFMTPQEKKQFAEKRWQDKVHLRMNI